MKKYLKQLIAVMVAIAMVVTIVPTQSVQAASKPKLNTTKKTLLVGSKFTLKVKNAEKNSTLTWKSSNKSAVTVSKKGVVKAVAGGESIVSCKVKTTTKTYNLKATIKVKDSKNVSTQKELNTALANEGITKITIKTDAMKKFKIGKGEYTNKLLIVEAPNAEVVNNGGVFKKIAIRSIAPNTWIERAEGNKFTVSSDNSRIVIGKDANVKSISVIKKDITTKVDIRGNVKKISMNKPSMNKPSILDVVGSAEKVKVEVPNYAKGGKINAEMPVDVNAKAPTTIELKKGAEGSSVTIEKTAEGSEVKTQVPVNVETAADTKIELGKGAEESKITVTENEAQVVVKNETETNVVVSTPEGDKTVNTGSESTVTDTNTGNTENDNSNQGTGDNTGTGGTPGFNGGVSGGGGGTPTVSVTNITLDKTEITLTEGETQQLTATVSPSNATNKTVTWTSSDENVATVNEEGLVTAVKAGTATITAKAGEKTATCTVTVNEKVVEEEPKPEEPTVVPVTEITLNQSTLDLEVEETATLTATVSPEDATDKAVTWTSSDENVATVNEEGLVTAVKAGTATITAKAGEVTATCTVTVKAKKINYPEVIFAPLKDTTGEVETVIDGEGKAKLVDGVVNLTATNLREHTNAGTGATKAYWIGFGITLSNDIANENVKYAFGETENPEGTITEADIYTDETGTRYLAVYVKLNADKTMKNNKFTVSLNGEVYTYEINVDNVTLYVEEINYPEVIFAPLKDTAGEVETVIDGEGKAELVDGVVNLTATNLREHTNAGTGATKAYWIGFGITLPNDIANENVKYAFGETGNPEGTITEADIYTNDAGTRYLTVYVKLNEDKTMTNDKFTVSLNGEVYTYEINVDGVTLDEEKITYPSVIFAPLKDTAGEVENVIDGEGTAELRDNGVVNLTATNLREHTNAGTGPTKAYWIGFGIELQNDIATESIKYAFGETGNPEGTITEADIYTNDAGTRYLTVYVKLNEDKTMTNNKFTVSLNGEVYTYEINVDNVTLYVETETTE